MFAFSTTGETESSKPIFWGTQESMKKLVMEVCHGGKPWILEE